MKMPKMILAIAPLLFVANAAGAAGGLGSVGQEQFRQDETAPIYEITIKVVQRSAKAINYRHRNGATKIDFSGTTLMPGARGEAKVESKQGYIEIEVEFDDLLPATRYGPEYLTYVMWAITPEGRATNLGEVILNGTKSKLNVTTEFQAFGLIVTAEPYFAVTQPSDVIVMENIVRKDTVGKIEQIEAKYELLERGQYIVNVLPADLQPIILDKDTPLDLYQARNAVRIARWAGADVSAAENFQKASNLLAQAENYKTTKAGSKPVAMTAREAVQTAEGARLIALKRQGQERLDRERAASADREAQANAATDRAQAEGTAARLQAERDREAARSKADQARKAAAEQVARDKAAARSKADQARKAAAEQAEREKQELRDQLAEQLNKVLETRDSARGLIVNMSDVLFDSGQHTLRPAARENLAKLSGILLAHLGLELEVEGHTDSIGTGESNMQLSERRANTVRDFLINEGIKTVSVTARGFGEDRPVATNDTAAGRQQNRRVELVVSGDVIGAQSGLTKGATLQP